MSLHTFANIVTPFGTAANNRGDGEGSNITPLQKLIWFGDSHTTVSAEAIRFAVRRLLAGMEERGTNREWNEVARSNEWKDWDFSGWATEEGDTYIDDDLLGFMTAEAAKEENTEEGPEDVVSASKGKKGKKAKGKANVRRAVLELTRAVSLTPWAGDVTFNSASPGATPSASKGENRSTNPVPYGTEVHATRYQFGLALTPERLRDKSRAGKALHAVGALGTVAGNHGRFLYDFSPDSIVIRVTDDPAPRLLYCFETDDDGRTVIAPTLFRRLDGGDIDAKELILGGAFAADPAVGELKKKGAVIFPNAVRAAIAEAIRRIDKSTGLTA